MKNFKAIIEHGLRNDVLFRERSNKDIGLTRLLIAKHSEFMYLIGQKMITPEHIVALVQDYASMDRAWRNALYRNPELRGKDYDMKESLEDDAKEKLGYNVK